jgi:hypothetical protein
MRIRRYSFIIIVLYTLNPLYSQFNTYSPYTRFGLGDLSKNGSGQNLAMGGTGIAIHNENRFNYLNPAASSALDSTSVYFDFGVNAFFNQYSFENKSDQGTPSISNTWWNMNLHHVAFASSMGKHFGFSTGIVPYSSIGYNIKQEYNDYEAGSAMDTYYTGDGGIMNFFVGASMKFFDRVSLGMTMNYLMGRLTRERRVEFPMDPDYSTVSSRENFDLRQPVFSLGLQYNEVIGEKYFFTFGAVYDLKADASATLKYDVVNSIYAMDPIILNDSVTITPEYYLAQDTIPRDFTIPRRIGIGLAMGIRDKLTITGDYCRQDWTGALSEGPGIQANYRTTQASSMHFGLEFIPDVEALRGYHNFIAYRVGGYFSNSYLSVLKPGTTDDYYQLEDYGITFGVGFPVKSLKSSLNVAFTLGTRGTTAFNLVKENYGIITFNVTLHDLWFRKRRFD